MLKKNTFVFVTLMLLLNVVQVLQAHDSCSGKIDLGVAYAHIDILESGHTVKTLNLPAIKADATILPFSGMGICLKPTILYGSRHGEIFTGGMGIGHCTPINEYLTLTPTAGCNFTEMHAHIDIDIPLAGIVEVKERFRSVSPYIGLEVSYKFAPCWRICGCIQYAWSRTHTKITHFGNFKSSTKGPNYAALIEHDLNDEWSVHVGAAYNISLSKEKHGLRGAGVKLGVARWF